VSHHRETGHQKGEKRRGPTATTPGVVAKHHTPGEESDRELQLQPQDDFATVYLTGVDKAEAFVEGLGTSLTGDGAHREGGGVWTGADVVHEQLQGAVVLMSLSGWLVIKRRRRRTAV
jgi:hypothetical protein